jgi:hypothetical protein
VADALGVDLRTGANGATGTPPEGAAGLADRSSRPGRSPMRPTGRAEEEIEALRAFRPVKRPFSG